ncbi:ubiquitin carboxyl-terminal hydrolase [Helicosporidium sp. ATCC 50920]|nr:ubiquitin carboxyl-terminal hydrolase [Helicosporidium sp. ATCC 50920]|eukprot:KDD75798.1 ubiquitin carboxyl-terminal hydrolase [Helicosporidium sp. ATCC 50920]
MVKVDIKWQKESFKGVEIDTAQPPLVFKHQLYSLCGVPAERQKILGLKGGLLKDDADWDKLGLREGQCLTLMGTADAVPEAPQHAQAFVEDLPEDEQDHSGLGKYGAGLENLGNTCYMNSTLQCLYGIPELRASLLSQPTSAGGPVSLAGATKHLFSRLTQSARPVPPMEFLLALRSRFPQFAQQSREGGFMQQDAEECWTNVLYALHEGLEKPAPASSQSVIDSILGIETESSLECAETGEKLQASSQAFMLKCNISAEVNSLAEGIRLGLRDDREARSEALGRLAPFVGTSAVTRLPPYLAVQMVRFYYKADVQQKAKILRRVAFPAQLDALEFCSEKVKRDLAGSRSALARVEDAAALRSAAAKKAKLAEAGEPRAGAEEAQVLAQEGVEEHRGKATGRYRLVGVLTHKGRSADSGHYVAWIRQEDGQWLLFDDDDVVPKKEEDVLALAGGGDWHMAYILLYKAVTVPGGEEEGQ